MVEVLLIFIGFYFERGGGWRDKVSILLSPKIDLKIRKGYSEKQKRKSENVFVMGK